MKGGIDMASKKYSDTVTIVKAGDLAKEKKPLTRKPKTKEESK